MLSRREFLPASASIVGVALAGKTLAQDLKCVAPCTPPRPVSWRETSTTMAVRTKMEPNLTLLKEKRNVHVLTPDEWDALGSHHQTYFTYHAGMGHCHAVDLGIQAHQAEFKKKYGAEKIDYLMEHGSYAVITQASKGIHAVGSKLRNAASEEAVIEPFLLSCGQFWASVDILLAITIFLIGTGPEAAPLVLLFTLIAILDDLIAIFTCP